MMISGITGHNIAFNNRNVVPLKNRTNTKIIELNRGVDNDTFVRTNKSEEITPRLMKKLENPNTFRDLYSPNTDKKEDTKQLAKMFEDPKFVEQAFSNPKVMKASTQALFEVSKAQFDEAYKNGADEETLEQLALRTAVLKVGLDSLKNAKRPEKAEHKAEIIPLENNMPQVAFAGILNYNVKNAKNQHNKAEAIVNKAATKAAGIAGLLAQSVIGDKILLKMETTKMVKNVFKTYDRSGGNLTAIAAVAGGFVAGSALAAAPFTIQLGIGNAANATITYGLHQLTGRACMLYCEKVPKKVDEKLSKAEAKAKFIRELKNTIDAFTLANDVLFDIATKALDKIIGV